jgi:hypothetical protein
MTYRVLGSASVFVLGLTLLALGQESPAGQAGAAAGPGGELGQQGQQAGQRGQRGQRAPARPTPRWPDGRVNLGPPSGEVGVWLPGAGGAERLVDPDNPNAGPAEFTTPPGPQFPGKPKVRDIPFQPWAKALYTYRRENQFEPHTRCKPSGGPRQFLTPYGVEFVDLPDLKRVYIYDIGGPHTYRIIYMDGRSHPKDLIPSYYGDSIGHWDGDTLVADTVGFNEKFWIDRQGLPHTEQLHMIERFTRTDMNTMKYEVTIDDPGAYTATWSAGFFLRWQPGQEMFEYVCQDNNKAPELMLGAENSVDRSSRIAP